jgi:biopolymer transport protein ExbD
MYGAHEHAIRPGNGRHVKVIIAAAKPPANPTSDRPPLVIEIPVTGDLVVGGQPVADATVDQQLTAVYQRDHETQVIIKAAPGVGHSRVVDLLERAKQVGLRRLAIAVSDN